jgi:LacI family transcriptional regulator
MKKKNTLQEIAQLAGVNPSTVSRAMNPATAHMISPEKRKRIQAICKKYHYRPRLSARAMATGKTYKVGLVLGAIEQDLSNPLFALFIRGLCGALQSQGYALSILWAGHPDSSTDNETTAFLESNAADGYILGSAMLGSLTREAARACGKPVVVLNTLQPGGIDPEFINLTRSCAEAYREAWQDIPPEYYLHVAFFGKNSPDSMRKFNEVCRFAPAKASCETFLFDSNRGGFAFDLKNAEEFAEQHLSELKRFKVFFCASDLTALGLASAFQRIGYKVGRDIMLIGFDNIEATFEGVNFPTIETPWEEAGRSAIQALFENLDMPKTAITIPFQCRYLSSSHS